MWLERALLLTLLVALSGIAIWGGYSLIRSDLRRIKNNKKNNKSQPTVIGGVISVVIVIGFFYLVGIIFQLLAPISGFIFGIAALIIVVIVGCIVLVFGLEVLGWAYEVGGIIGFLIAIYLLSLFFR